MSSGRPPGTPTPPPPRRGGRARTEAADVRPRRPLRARSRTLRPLLTTALTRGWVFVLSIVGVSAIALLVGNAQTTKYEAKTTLVVPATLGSSPVTGVLQAAQLAQIYRPLIANDGALRTAVMAQAKIGPTQYRRGLSIRNPGGSVLMIRFAGASDPQALAVVRAVAHRLLTRDSAGGQIPHGTFSQLSAPAVVPAQVAGVPTDAATAALAVRPSKAGPASALNADPARYLAETYAAVIPLDTGLHDYVNRRLRAAGLSDARPTLAATSAVNTSVITVTASGQTPAAATQAARAVATGVAGAAPATSNVAANTLSVLSLPTHATATAGPRSLLPAGIIVGVLLGIVLLVGWARGDPRVDSAEDLRTVLGVPATSLRSVQLDQVTREGLLARWEHARGAAPGEIGVALLAGSGRVAAQARELAELLRTADGDRGLDPLGEPRVTVVTGEEELAATMLAEDPFCVLVARRGARTRRLRRSVEQLAEYGRAPDWALLIDR